MPNKLSRLLELLWLRSSVLRSSPQPTAPNLSHTSRVQSLSLLNSSPFSFTLFEFLLFFFIFIDSFAFIFTKSVDTLPSLCNEPLYLLLQSSLPSERKFERNSSQISNFDRRNHFVRENSRRKDCCLFSQTSSTACWYLVLIRRQQQTGKMRE